MKKILTLMITSLLLSTMVYAQEEWKPKTATNSISFRMGLCKIERNAYMYDIYMTTDNIYDKVISIPLGNNREEALESINELIAICEEGSGLLRFFKAKHTGKTYEFYTFGNMISFGCIQGEIHYGNANLYYSELKRMRKFIEQKK